MADIKEMYKNFGISEDVYDYSVKNYRCFGNKDFKK